MREAFTRNPTERTSGILVVFTGYIKKKKKPKTIGVQNLTAYVSADKVNRTKNLSL